MATPAPVARAAFEAMKAAYPFPYRLLAAFSIGDAVEVLVSFWPKGEQLPLLTLDRHSRADELMGFLPPAEFIERQPLDRYRLGPVALQLRAALAGRVTFEQALTQVRSEWTQRHYYQHLDESALLQGALKPPQP